MISVKKAFNQKKARILEPVILGVSANILINFLFNPTSPDFLLKEFIVAIIFAFIITELNRFIYLKIENTIDWKSSFKSKLVLNFFTVSTLLIIILNTIGNLYIWLSGDSFHSLEELLLINLIVLSIVLILSLTRWCMFLHNKWVLTQKDLTNNKKENLNLKQLIHKSSKKIKLSKRNSIFMVEAANIKLAILEYGNIKIYDNKDILGVFEGSLANLESQLPKAFFFKVSRQVIIHREEVKKMSPSNYGKIELELHNKSAKNPFVMISRLKASKFRQWYYSNSSID
ncbi:LytTR family DNA-binding domain-containing protein [Winogradskyella haliclonae]|uniref:HTH LytTR-type domain-containing protein n=1 Tax=Winogradskyella haliclonae TaxID=2048558 RepID=A0ABQ2BW99_9FLAO|nr:LytTR family DNA-binding domain-containing protein [Winogradskyella haliclonae]GGI56725.1 hypothetical protein GCM10011444_10340 [Winogradskyella haliclonae]